MTGKVIQVLIRVFIIWSFIGWFQNRGLWEIWEKLYNRAHPTEDAIETRYKYTSNFDPLRSKLFKKVDQLRFELRFRQLSVSFVSSKTCRRLSFLTNVASIKPCFSFCLSDVIKKYVHDSASISLESTLTVSHKTLTSSDVGSHSYVMFGLNRKRLGKSTMFAWHAGTLSLLSGLHEFPQGTYCSGYLGIVLICSWKMMLAVRLFCTMKLFANMRLSLVMFELIFVSLLNMTLKWLSVVLSITLARSLRTFVFIAQRRAFQV